MLLRNSTRAASILLLVSACGSEQGGPAPDAAPTPDASLSDGALRDAADAATPDAAPTDGAPATACAAGPAGLDCLFSLWSQRASCEASWVAAFTESIRRRHGDLPAWYEGKALFVGRGGSVSVAGTMNNWQAGALVTQQVCGTDLYASEVTLAGGRYTYKLVTGAGSWILDPENFAFAYDDFSGNPDGRNSVLNTYDSGLGNLVMPDQDLCSQTLGRCGPLLVYLPPAYGDPQNANRSYPVLFMHDGQNIYDNHTCCFGHTGWEVNVTLDRMIPSGEVSPVVVVGFPHGGDQRAREYVYDLRDAFMDFQVTEVQPRAQELFRIDPSRAFVAGSSFGGNVTFLLASTHPSLYVGAASLSGAYWPDDGAPRSIYNIVSGAGKTSVALYLDHGGSSQDGQDGYFDSLRMRDELVGLGWTRSDAPSCTLSSNSVCYYWDPGALHNELAWKDRAHLFLHYFFAAR